MRAQSYIIGAVLCILLFVSPSLQKNTLRVNTVFAASGEVITVTPLQGDNAVITDSSTDTISFGSQDELQIDAPGISVAGNYFKVSADSDITVHAEGNDVNIGSNQVVDVDAGFIDVLSSFSDIDVHADQGNLFVQAGADFTMHGDLVEIDSTAGGVLIKSEGGNVEINAGDDVFFTSAGITDIDAVDSVFVDSKNSVNFHAEGQNGEIDVDAQRSLNMLSTNTFAVQGDNIEYYASEAVDIGANDLDIVADTGALTIKSATDDVTIGAGQGLSIESARELVAEGANDGVRLQAGPGALGTLGLNSAAGISFTAIGNGDVNGVKVSSNSATLTASETASVTSLHTVLDADGSLNLLGNKITASSSTTSTYYSDNVLFSSKNTFDIKSTNSDIHIKATDPASSTGGEGSISVTATGKISYTVATAFEANGGDITFKSAVNDITLTANPVFWSADRAKGVEQQFHVNAVDTFKTATNGLTKITSGLAIFDSKGSSSVQGADIALTAASNEGDTITISSTGSDVVLTSSGTTTFSPAGDFSILANNDIQFTAANGMSIDNSNGDVAHSSDYVANDIFFQAGNQARYTSNVDQDWAFLGAASIKSTQDSVTFSAVTALYENYTSLATKASAAKVHGDSLVEVNTVAPPGATDSVSVEATGDISISTLSDPIVWTAAGSLTVTSAHVLSIQGQTGVRLGTDGRETFTWSAASDLTSVTQRTITDSANSVDFAGSSIELTANQVNINSLDRGLNSVSGADTSFTGTLSNLPVSIFAAGNVEFFSFDSMTTKANSVTMTGASGLYVDSSAGNVDLTASTKFSIQSANNMFFNAGNSTGDSLTITDGSTNINTDTFQVKVDQSYLKIDNALDTTISAQGRDNTFSSDGDVLLSTKTLSIIVEASTSVVGGNVDFTAGTDFSTNAGSFAIASNAVTEGERAITGVNDNILYQSTAVNMAISTLGGNFDLAGGDNGIISANTTFKVASGNTNFKSTQNKRDITVLSSGTMTQQSKNFGIVYNSANNLTVTAQNYYNATGGKTVNSNAGEDQTIESNSGCLLVTASFGNVFLQAVTSNLAQTQDVSVNAESTVTVRSTALPLSVSASGHSNQREDADPANTGAGLYDTVGLTVTTEHPQGNIFIHSVNSGITVNTVQDVVIQSEAFASLEAITGETVQGSAVSVSAQDAGLGIYGARGVTATARTGSATFDSSRYASFTSEDSLRSTVTNNIDIKAEGGPIIAFTSNGRDIFFESTSGAFVAKAGGAGNDWNAQGAVSITSSASTIAVSGYHGVSVATTNGNMNYTASNGGISFNSKEETVFNSGSDLFLTANNVNINSKTAGYLTTSQGDIAYSATTSFATSATDYLNIQSKGTSQSGRDHVLLSGTNTLTLTAPTITLEATESLEFGATTTPVINWSGTGDVSHPGFVLNSGGNVDISTQNALTMSGRDLAATTTSNYKVNALGQVFYSTSGAAGFTATSSAGLKVDAPNAEVRLTSSAGPVRLASEEIFRLEANGKANTDTVTFTANTGTYTTKADLVSEEHSGTLAVTANNAAPADAISFLADGTLSVTTATGGNGVITLTATAGAESFTSGGVQSWRTTADSAPITIDNTAASTMAISTGGVGSVLTFQANDLFQARAGNGLTVNARVGDLHVHTPTTTLTATAGVQTWTGAQVYMQTDYDFTGTSTNAQVQISAARAASFLSSDTFQVLPKAGNNAGTLTLDFPGGRVETKGGKVTYQPTTTSTLQATSPFFNSTEGFISLTSGAAFSLTSASHSAAFVSQGPSDQLLVSSLLDMTVGSGADLKLQAGSSQVNGLLSVTAQGKMVWTAANDINLTGGAAIGLDPQGALSATAGGIRVTAANIPILANSASFTTSRPPNVNPLQPNARSWIRFLAGQSGGATAFSVASAKAVVLNAAQGSVLFDSKGATTLLATKDIAIHTEKSASGILFDTQDDSVSHALTLSAKTLLDSESADKVSYVATGADGSISFLSNTFQADAKSFPRQDRAGIDAHAGVITVSKVTTSTLSTNAQDSDIRLTGREGLAIFNGGAVATTFVSQNAGRITVTADGGEYNPASAIPALTGVLEQRVGIDFTNGFNTISATATNGAITMQGGQDVYQVFNTITYGQVSSGAITSLGNVQLSATTIAITATGPTATGIYMRGAKGLDIVNGAAATTVFQNFPTLNVVAGRAEAETSKLLIQTSGDQTFTSTAGSFSALSDDNIAVRALNSISIASAGPLNILAYTGGHMYQSTTVAGSPFQDVLIQASNGGIEINPFEHVRHTQHLALGFFQAMSPQSPTRGFPPYDLSTTRAALIALGASSGCTYSATFANVGPQSGDLQCYNSKNRIFQVLNALAEYGLILD